MDLELESFPGDLIMNMEFVMNNEGWMGFQQAKVPGRAFHHDPGDTAYENLVCWE